MPPTSPRRAGGAALAAIIVLCAGGVIALSIARARRAEVESEELEAATALKTVLFPAEVRFQKDAVRDDDHDQVGEFGGLGELAHGNVVLPADLVAGAARGYRFA